MNELEDDTNFRYLPMKRTLRDVVQDMKDDHEFLKELVEKEKKEHDKKHLKWYKDPVYRKIGFALAVPPAVLAYGIIIVTLIKKLGMM